MVFKRLTAAAVAAAMLASCAARAAEWIELSAWSYAGVSGFVSEGLLPDCLRGIGSYKREINRGEFCELVYSVLKKANMITMDVDPQIFSDCENYPNVNRLYDMVYDSPFFLRERDDNRSFHPGEPITRKEAGLVIGAAMQSIGVYDYYSRLTDGDRGAVKAALEDYDEVVSEPYSENIDDLLILLREGIMSDMGDGKFHPNDAVSVEQAVTLAWRMYKAIPRMITSDNEGGAESRDIGAGLTEVITEDYYNVTRDGGALMSFETDVYSKLLAGNYGAGTLIFGVNFNDKTDVFDADTRVLLYTIPYIVNELDEESGYAFTVSNRFFPSYTGLYSMDNAELIKPEYSRREIGELIENGMAPSKEEYRAADGWVYYADWNDNGHMYKVDTNGENMSCVVDDLDCTNLKYIDGVIYFNDNKDWRLHSVREDGSDRRDLSAGRSFLTFGNRVGLYPYKRDYVSAVYGKDFYGFYDISSEHWGDDFHDYDVYTDVYGDGSLLCYDSVEGALQRDVHPDDAEPYTERRSGKRLFRLMENGERVQLADFYVSDAISACNGDGKVWFMNEELRFCTGKSPIYMCDADNRMTRVGGDFEAACFGFLYNTETDTLDCGKLAFKTQEEIPNGTYHILDLDTGEVTFAELAPESENRFGVRDEGDKIYYEDFCTDEFKLWDRYGFNKNLVRAEYNGKTEELGDISPVQLLGDHLYYADAGGGIYAGYRNRVQNNADLIRYNYKTGEKTVVANDFNSSWEKLDKGFVYQSGSGTLKTVLDGSPALTVWPAKGLHRYGEAVTICHAPRALGQKRRLYKIDTNGNLTALTEHDAENAIYVKNRQQVNMYIR